MPKNPSKRGWVVAVAIFHDGHHKLTRCVPHIVLEPDVAADWLPLGNKVFVRPEDLDATLELLRQRAEAKAKKKAEEEDARRKRNTRD